MRVVALLVVLLGAACTYEPFDSDPAAVDDDDKPLVAIEPIVSTEAARAPLPGLILESWSAIVASG